MFDFFKLKSPMGRSYNVDYGDVTNTKKALNNLNYYNIPDHGLTQYPETSLFSAIQEFQSDKGLKQDGFMNTDGPTEAALNDELAKKSDFSNSEEKPAKKKTRPVTSILSTPSLQSPPAQLQKKNLVGLQKPVGMSLQNKSDDVLSTKRALRWAGHLPEQQAPHLNSQVNDVFLGSIGNFQKAMGLKQDHQMMPGGETEKTLNSVIQQKLMKLVRMADDPSEDEEPKDPPKDEEPKDPPKDGDPKDPPKDKDPKDPPKDENPKEPPKDDDPKEPPKEEDKPEENPCADIESEVQDLEDEYAAMEADINKIEQDIDDHKNQISTLEDETKAGPAKVENTPSYPFPLNGASAPGWFLKVMEPTPLNKGETEWLDWKRKTEELDNLKKELADLETELKSLQEEMQPVHDNLIEAQKQLDQCKLENDGQSELQNDGQNQNY